MYDQSVELRAQQPAAHCGNLDYRICWLQHINSNILWCSNRVFNVFLTAFVVKLLPLLSPVTLHHPTWSRRQPVSALPKQISSFSFCQSERDQFRNAPWKTKNIRFGFAVTVSMKMRRLSVFEACWNVLVCVQHLIIYTPSVCEVLLIKRITKSFSSS